MPPIKKENIKIINIDISKLAYILPQSELSNRLLFDDDEFQNSHGEGEREGERERERERERKHSLYLDDVVNELSIEWQVIIKSSSDYKILCEKLEKDSTEKTILPDKSLIFNAFKLCPKAKVVILGQDPYFSNKNEAMGLSFSVPDGVKIPPTLVNIFKELSTDIPNFTIPKSGNLVKWSKEGVLLLNTALSVVHGVKESHIKIWTKTINHIIERLSQESETPIVFMIWGNHAKKKSENIMRKDYHLILEATHPSPLGAIGGGWFSCKHFSKCNDFLLEHGLTPIDWKLI